MIKIIKEGAIAKEMTYQTYCGQCYSQMTFNKTDMQFLPLMTMYVFGIRCPLCHTVIKIDTFVPYLEKETPKTTE